MYLLLTSSVFKTFYFCALNRFTISSFLCSNKSSGKNIAFVARLLTSLIKESIFLMAPVRSVSSLSHTHSLSSILVTRFPWEQTAETYKHCPTSHDLWPLPCNLSLWWWPSEVNPNSRQGVMSSCCCTNRAGDQQEKHGSRSKKLYTQEFMSKPSWHDLQI